MNEQHLKSLSNVDGIIRRIELIKSGKKNRLYEFELANYYLSRQEFTIEFCGIEFKLDALYCDAFYRSSFVSEIKNHDINFLVEVLSQVVNQFNLVIYENVISSWSKHDKELLDYVFSNYVTHFISIPYLLIPENGLLISKRKQEVKNTSHLNRTRIARNVKEIRKLKQIKQEDLVRGTSASERTLRNIENAKENNFSFRSLEEIANALRVDVSQLL